MFTGLIEATGVVESIVTSPAGLRLTIGTPMGAELTPGESIAVNGVCLTVTTQTAEGFQADVAPETMRVTSLGRVAGGSLVNLERPVRADARLGGHFVLGHVDGVGEIRVLRDEGESRWLEVEAPAALSPYFIPKGSVAIDGISLTIARIEGLRIGVQIVPFTWAHTALRSARVGDAVNIEGDVLGKYVVRLLESRTQVSTPVVPAGMS
jgi:riboflavin synthase